jgi:hypothetical protein
MIKIIFRLVLGLLSVLTMPVWIVPLLLYIIGSAFDHSLFYKKENIRG